MSTPRSKTAQAFDAITDAITANADLDSISGKASYVAGQPPHLLWTVSLGGEPYYVDLVPVRMDGPHLSRDTPARYGEIVSVPGA